ncbi:MAG: hypothetical protein WDO74_14485 [Pseudomonadota bacterium]
MRPLPGEANVEPATLVLALPTVAAKMILKCGPAFSGAVSRPTACGTGSAAAVSARAGVGDVEALWANGLCSAARGAIAGTSVRAGAAGVSSASVDTSKSAASSSMGALRSSGAIEVIRK